MTVVKAAQKNAIWGGTRERGLGEGNEAKRAGGRVRERDARDKEEEKKMNVRVYCATSSEQRERERVGMEHGTWRIEAI